MEELAEVEQKLNIKIPKKYVELLTQSNGGEITYNKIEFDFEKTTIDYLLSLTLDKNAFDGVFCCLNNAKECGLREHILPLAWNPYPHALFALDYSEVTDEPPVVYYYENYPGENMVYSKHIIATSFEQFLSMLYSKPLLKPNQIINKWKKSQ